jgi:ABC-type branched-subunit amino acid transport system ATPase component
MTIPALQVTGVSKNFGALRVADDIHFFVDTGVRHALIGPNGAGKTTLLNLITGVVQPTAGTICLAGVDITRMHPAERSRLGLARTFQINQLFHGLTVLDNVCLPIAERTGASRSLLRPAGWYGHVTDEAVQLLRDLRLLDIALTPIHALAYGQQRLVEIAIALGQRPQVLLLDEPTAGVPASESQLLLEVIEALSDDISVVIIEHDMDVVFRFAQRITVLVGGRILMEGDPHEVANDTQVKAVYLGETNG